MKTYYAYLVQCSDGTFYTGYTADLDKRLQTHNSSIKGAKYTRNKRPVILKYFEKFDTKSEAMKREYKLKQLTHAQKAALK